MAEGDEGAFRELLDRHQPALYRFARRFLQDAVEAEDVAQEVFLRLYRSAHRYRPRAALRAYLFRIARNLCVDHLRKQRPGSMESAPEAVTRETPLTRLESAQAMNRLLQAVADLPENQRAALLMRHDQGLRYREIAEAMEISVAAVESLLVRARRTLRQRVRIER
ncbi:MAG: sigma-70 family RNA polymerase sigma factor [Proteobacteria bacterium]|nr:sigma-70 family RNA polymerase sigma factor [Pseudomonadota bacterium]